MPHYHLMTDQDLVRLFQNGDEHAFEELLHRHKNKIFSTIFFLVRDRELAEDLFQDSFIRIINGLRNHHYNEEGKFIAWAARIARNTVIDYFRTKKKAYMVRENDEYSPFDIIQSSGRNAEEQMVYNEKVNFVKKMIDGLPEIYREVVILRHYAGLSFKEISATLNVNMNTCLCRMHNAIKEMKEVVSGQKAGVVQKKKGRRPKVVVHDSEAKGKAGKETVNKE
jgi:RNA polymerase sigma factor (sigma-70 family)